jgi:hypothetical protein
MDLVDYVAASAEKGWGMFLDMRINRDLVRFSISNETLTTVRRGERTFPEIFERNLATILSAAKLLTSGCSCCVWICERFSIPLTSG